MQGRLAEFNTITCDPFWGSPLIERHPMTVIVVAKTDAGFIVGADGKTGFSDNTPTVFDKQKIFKATNNHNHFVYCLSGTTAFPPEYDLIDSSKRIAESLKSKPFSAGIEYICSFTTEIRSVIVAAQEKYKDQPLQKDRVYFHQLNPFKRGHIITGLTVVGYFNSEPFANRCQIIHCNQVVDSECHREEIADTQGFPDVNGPKYIRELAIHGDSRFSEYADGIRLPFTNDLDAANRFVDTYIQLCCDPEAGKADEECKFVGGRIHIAKITRSGISWQPRREPINDCR